MTGKGGESERERGGEGRRFGGDSRNTRTRTPSGQVQPFRDSENASTIRPDKRHTREKKTNKKGNEKNRRRRSR